MTMHNKTAQAAIDLLKKLIDASEPFTDDSVVDATSGTIPKMERLEEVIEEARQFINNPPGETGKDS